MKARRVILGLNFGFHDSSAALVINNKVIGAVGEERFNRQNQIRNFPINSIQFLIKKEK